MSRARFATGAALFDELRASHDALLVALRWCVSHEGECLGDHPEVLAKVRAAIAQAEGAG